MFVDRQSVFIVLYSLKLYALKCEIIGFRAANIYIKSKKQQLFFKKKWLF